MGWGFLPFWKYSPINNGALGVVSSLLDVLPTLIMKAPYRFAGVPSHSR
jgi:hypothetical protein